MTQTALPTADAFTASQHPRTRPPWIDSLPSADVRSDLAAARARILVVHDDI
jgi:hypothetical protein